mgnify:FL=1
MAPKLKRNEIVRPLLLLGTLVALILVLVSLQVAAA